MSSLFHVKISDLSGLSNSSKSIQGKLDNKDLALLTDRRDNYKVLVDDLSSYIKNEALKSDLSSQTAKWTFKNKIHLDKGTFSIEQLEKLVNTHPYLAVNKETIDNLSAYIKGLLDEIYKKIYEDINLPSYIGQVLITSLSSEAEIRKIYGGAKWEQRYSGYFIAGLDKNDDRYDVYEHHYNVGNNSVLLDGSQVPLKSHTHTIKPFTGNSTSVSYINYPIPWSPGSQNFGRHGRKNFATNITKPVNLGCGTSVSVTVEGDSTRFSKCADKEYDNRPAYQCLYIWKRIS